ncbi:MAG: DUF3352 domain-containing protein [Moorea sp. SIO2B7]|nr:DUF3352 domain-containing protein [Moorena sp. SIO2B7]
MKLRSFFLTLAAGCLLLLLIAAGSLYWILAQSPLNLLQEGITKEPAAAIFIPRQAPVMISMLVNPDRLEAFRQLSAPPGKRRRSRWELNQLKKSLLANTELKYQKDIQPWLGDEITLAVNSLDFDHNPENGVKPGYLLAVTTKDAQLAREFLQLSFSQQAIAGTSDLVFEQYKGINLIYQRPLIPEADHTIVASAVVGDFVLFANHPKVLRDAINNVQVPNLNLKNSPSYQGALKTILEPNIGITFVNLPALSAWIANSSVSESPEIEQMLTIALSLKRQGLVAQTALIGVAGEESQAPALSEPVEALKYVPAETILTAAGTNLNQFWTQIATGLEQDSPLQQLLNQALSRVQEPLNITLSEDIFSWVTGEYSLSLVPNPQGGEPDWVFVAEKTPDANSDEAIEHLDNLAKEQGLSVGNLPLLDTNITAWTKLVTTSGMGKEESLARLDAEVKGVHTSVGKYEIFTTSIEAMAHALQEGENSLVESEKFQQAIAALPPENDGYFYIDWNQSEPIVEQKLPLIRFVELAGEPLFNNLRSLTLSSQGSENSIRRATVFFNLGAK